MIPPELQSILDAMPKSEVKTRYMITLTSDNPLYANGREWLIKYLSKQNKPAMPKMEPPRIEPGATEPDEPSCTQTVDKCPMPTAAALMDRLKDPKPLPDTPVMADAAFFEAENKALKAQGD